MRPSPPDRRCRRLLVVDDEPSICALLRTMLEMEGFQVTEAASAREAMRALEQRDIDILITDIQMPGVSGVELAQSVRAEQRELPILLISGLAPEQAATACGCSFLRKPFSFADLTGKVRELLPTGRRSAGGPTSD